jgi:hypothetical protein
VDITELILSDHHEQRRRFAMLDDVDPADTTTLGSLWLRLAGMLEAHAKAEELYFYPELLKLGKRRENDNDEIDETVDAIEDHNDIREGIELAAQHEVGSDGWWKGVNAAREANDEHMGEEEHEGLADFRRHSDLETRHRIALPFAEFEARFSDGVPVQSEDPQQYVERYT